MAKRIVIILVLGVALVSLPVNAAETKAVGEMFFCTFHDSKGWDDVETATALFKATTEKVGNGWENVDAFVWRPFRANVDYDFLWASYTDNLNHWGQTMDAYMASEEGQTANALWDTVAKCDSALTCIEQIFDSEAVPASDQARSIVESFVCKKKEGTTEADLQAASEVWHAHVTKLGLEADVYMRTPLVINSEYDHSYFEVYKDFSAYASASTSYLTDAGTAAVSKVLNDVETCESALWTAWQVLSAPE